MWPQKHGGDVIPQLRYFLAITNRSNSEEKDFFIIIFKFLSVFKLYFLQYSKANTEKTPNNN